jgi:hypothetical protein
MILSKQPRFLFVLMGLLAFGLFSGTAVAKPKTKTLHVTAEKAPVAPDGTTVGAHTDFVLTFKDIDPDKKGMTLRKGATVEVVLPPQFTNVSGGGALVLLQGWPQSPPAPPPAFLWTTVVVGNTATLTMNEDFKVGTYGPGTKQVHLILLGFDNPGLPGVYPVELTIRPKPSGKKVHRGIAQVRIIPDARPSVNPVALFSGPPGPPPPFFNPIYQTVGLGEDARQVGLYLWDANSAAFTDVDLTATAQPSYYQLTDIGSNVVGEVFITAPSGAESYSLSSVPLPPGGPPSVQIPAFVTGVPVGVLGIQFSPDPWVHGDYEIAISMRGGNEKTLYVSVPKPRGHDHH